jgi:hypothetical protein
MSTLTLPPAIASAAAVFLGRHGDVSRLARQRHVHRQTLYRQAHALVRSLDRAGQHRRCRGLQRRVAAVEAALGQHRRQQRHDHARDTDRLAEFAATAQALGVSLSSARALLRVWLGGATPSVARLGRLSRQAGQRAQAVLGVLDEPSRARARHVAADEIRAGRRLVLMTVEQGSLCWLGGRLADACDGTAWAREFEQLPAVEQLTRDGGAGLRRGLAAVNRCRRQRGEPPIADQEDHFHLLQRAARALSQARQQAARALRKAEAAQRAFERDAWRGLRRSPARSRSAKRHWQLAGAAFDRWSAQEKAFTRLRSALRLFTPEGELNTRPRAEALTREALAQLHGADAMRVRRRLSRPETFTFLDRVGAQLAALTLPAPVREAVVHGEGLRRQPEALRGAGPHAAALRGVALAAGVVVSLLAEAGQEAVRAVRSILDGAWRASSLVEGLNSVLRMQQARQKRLTPELLALKRLYWNAHVFAAGRRKGQSPYGGLGLALPAGSWWQLLKMPPEQLRQQLSALNPAA